MSDEHLMLNRRPEWDEKLDKLWAATQERDARSLAASDLRREPQPEPTPDPAA